MSYQVLARKWRPPDFTSLVGQDHVVTALRNALADRRIAQAYLFSGIRGVGKTTAARILAKALNCLKGLDAGPATDPCNECTACREINTGASLDVLEVDAATYSKVEQVRELTETLRYGPAHNRYKVVVLDEVHRLSRQAFDALLKIVEEPPAHLIFIFATTEIDTVPATILSRCQEFQFRRVSSPVISSHLRSICDAEEITVSETALRLIARTSEGSVRDAVALLDQMSTFGHGTISDDAASQILATFDAAFFHRLLAAILHGAAPEVSRMAREVEANGWDPQHVFGQFLGFCRDGLHLAMDGEPQSVDLPVEEARILGDLVRDHAGSYRGLLQILQLLLRSEATVRRSEFGTIALEIAWLRAAELPKVRQVEALLAGKIDSDSGGSGPSGGSRTGHREVPSTNPENLRAHRDHHRESTLLQDTGEVDDPTHSKPATKPETSTTSETKATPERQNIPTTPTAAPIHAKGAKITTEAKGTDGPMSEPDSTHLDAVLDLLPKSLIGLLSGSRLDIRNGAMVVTPKPGDHLIETALRRERNTRLLDQALYRVYGKNMTWSIRPDVDGPEVVPQRKEPTTRALGVVTEKPADPLSQQLTPGTRQNGMPRGVLDSADESPSHGRVHSPSDPGPRDELWAVRPESIADLPTVLLVQSIFKGKIRSVRDEADDICRP